LIAALADDDALRGRVVARQRQRVRAFLEPQVRRQWEGYLRDLELLPARSG
jgi:hypothetical protein